MATTEPGFGSEESWEGLSSIPDKDVVVIWTAVVVLNVVVVGVPSTLQLQLKGKTQIFLKQAP